ncbi:MAG TPA: TPM domain-containing protein [Kiloniellales bacterium]
MGAIIVLAGLFALFAPAGEPAAAAAVDDGAALMSEDQRARVAEYHGYLFKDHDIDYRVVTAEDVGDISHFAVVRFADLGVGEASSAGRGLLLVIDPAQDRVRLEVGYALEGAFPDAFVAYVEQRQMAPFFRAGRVADGILAATELIVTRAQRAAANAGFEGEAWMAGSGGGGATANADIGQGWTNEATSGATVGVPSEDAATAAGRSPEETLGRYLGAMAARNGDPGLALYTAETQGMLRNWVMTPAQMTNVARTYRGCTPERTRTDASGDLAVIRYPVAQRECAPWFFRRGDRGWGVDLTMMQRAIRFGRSNAWHFDLAADHPYRFAFADWRFDANGFPLGK